jgi:chemotaxis protein MotB
MARRRRKREEEHENLDRWIVSYADFITLLFAFFVTMYAISRVDESKLGSVVESLQRALGSLIPAQISQKETMGFSPGSPADNLFNFAVIPTIAEEKGKISEKEQFEKLAAEIQQEMERIFGYASLGNNGNGAAANQIKYIIDKRGLIIRVPESLFFNSGQASIRPEFLPVLNALAQSLEIIPNHIRIEGHTDSVPINTVQFPSNWELSTARATTITRYLLDYYPFAPNKLSATGYAEFHPIASNSTPEGRLQNRRVDVVILNLHEEQIEPKEKEDKAAQRQGGESMPLSPDYGEMNGKSGFPLPGVIGDGGPVRAEKVSGHE